jgi:hypothetical protein
VKKSSSKQLEARVGQVAGVVVGVAGVVMGVEMEVVLAAEAPKRREIVRARKDILFELKLCVAVVLLFLCCCSW